MITLLLWAWLIYEGWKWYEKFHFPDCGIYCEKTHWQKLNEIESEKRRRADAEWARAYNQKYNRNRTRKLIGKGSE